jgi:hypothetical protein
MAIKYTNIFHCKTVQNFTKIATFGLKIYHPATLVLSINSAPEKNVAASWYFGVNLTPQVNWEKQDAFS